MIYDYVVKKSALRVCCSNRRKVVYYEESI